MPAKPPTHRISIDPKHARLQNFLAGKGLPSDKPVEIEVSNTELTSLMRKAKEHGFEHLIKASKAAVKKATKANEERAQATTQEPVDEEPSDETTADSTIQEAEAEAKAEEEELDETPKRRRRA